VDDNGDEEAATRIVWFEEGKLDLYLASGKTYRVGHSLRPGFYLFVRFAGLVL